MEWSHIATWATTTPLGMFTVSIAGSLVAAGLWTAGKAAWRRLLTSRAVARRQAAGEDYAARCIEAAAFGTGDRELDALEPPDPMLALLYVVRTATTGLKNLVLAAGFLTLGMSLGIVTHPKGWGLLGPMTISAVGWLWLVEGMKDVTRLQRLLNERTVPIRALAWQTFDKAWTDAGRAPSTLVRPK